MPQLCYLNWLDNLVLPSLSNHLQTETPEERARMARIEAAVRGAMERLPDDQRELIWLYHFDGLSLSEIAGRSGRSVHKIESLHRRSIAKLKHSLAGFVRDEFGIEPPETDCPICNSPFCSEINALIRNRDTTRTWAPVLRKIKREYGLNKISVQRLIGHSKYHMAHDETKGAEE